MKNFGSILALVALSASVVSARVLPAGDSIQVRSPDLAEIYAREQKKNKGGAAAGKESLVVSFHQNLHV
jgi:hypothetical protein